jgi:hypothetical protein
MFSKLVRICIAVAPTLLLVACGGSYNTVAVAIQAEYQKRAITTTGLSPATYQPAKYCYVEGFDPHTNNVYFSGYLNSMGRGIGDVPQDASFMVRLYARYEVPGQNNSGDFLVRGSVKDGTMAPKYSSAASFNAIPDWSVMSGPHYSGGRDFGITVSALDSTRDREAGAFSIAAQAVDFAQKMSILEPGLGLPNLHSFWSPDNDHYTDYPQAAFDGQFINVLTQSSGRAIFQHRVMGYGNAFTSGRGDEYNDSALMDSFAHMLFADYSYPAVSPAHPFGRIVRRDSEDIAWVERHIASEATTAFVGGFCDFMSAALRDSPMLLDITSSSVASCNLNTSTNFPKPNGGEFYRQSVASALYRIWKSSFGGTIPGLQTMWGATFQRGMALEVTGPNYPFGYLQCPMGNISSYLSGLANGSAFGVTNNVWISVLNIIGSESISNPNANFFSQDKLWKRIASFPAVETGYIRTYPEGEGIYWDADQAAAFFFAQSQSVQRKITLEMTGGQDLYLELFDDQGILEQNFTYSSGLPNKVITRTLDSGNYLVRVRAGNTTQSRNAGFKLTIQ